MPSWSWRRHSSARLAQLRAQMAAEQEDLVQFDKDDPDFLPREDANGDAATLHEYHSELKLLGSDGALSAPSKSAIYRVRRFFDSLHSADSPSLGERSPVPPDRRGLLLRRCLHRRLQQSRSAAAVPAAAVAAAVKHADSPWPSPARGRRPPPLPLRDVHSTPDVLSGEGTLSAASSLTNVSTISSSYVGDELDLDDWEDEPQEEGHYPDQDWLTCDRSALQITVDTRNSSASSSFRSGIHFTARRVASPSSLLGSSVGSVGIQFTAPPVVEPEQAGTLTEDYGKMLTLEGLTDYNSSCLTCGVNWRNEEAGLDCNECGGYPLSRPCPQCSGNCAATWSRDLNKSHDTGTAAWTGVCQFRAVNDSSDRSSDVTPVS